ncbi:MAG: ABC transporter ATP-binding protein [Pseudobdellovibrionaceae bacterium]
MSFVSEDQVQTQTSYRVLLRRLWPYLKKQKWNLFLSLVSVLLLAVVSRFTPLLIGQLIDKGFGQKQISTFIWIGYAYLACEVGKSFLNLIQTYLFQKLGNRCLFFVREDLVKHVQSLPMDFFNKTPTGRTVTRMTNDVFNLGDFFSQGVIFIFTQTVVLLSIVAALFWISWKLALICLILTPIFIFLSLRLNEKIRGILRESKKKLSTMNSFLAENISGIKVVQLYNRSMRNNQFFNNLSKDYLSINMQSIRSYALMYPIMNLLNATVISLGLYFGGWQNQNHALTIGAVVAFIMNLQDLIPPLRDILERLQQFQNSITSAERVFHLLDEKPEDFSTAASVSLPDKLQGHIQIKNLSFRYSDELPWVLQNISLEIPAGSSLALVGRTGSGKSTVISLLQRFYEAPTGCLYIDDQDILKYPRSWLRKKMGVVQQDPFIFRGSLLDNIRLSDANISADKVQKACELIGYDNLLKQSGRDLQSFIEEKGSNLSVGERQLVAFARILVFDPDILILDEATANIDSNSERLLQKATQEVIKNRTSILIAHRLSTIKDCTQIAVLDHGELKECGSHDQLMAQKGLYYQLAWAGVKSTAITASAAGTAVP